MGLPQISGRELVRILKKDGFVAVRQRGDHLRMEKNTGSRTIKLTIPLHKELKKGTLGRILKDAGIDAERFTQLR